MRILVVEDDKEDCFLCGQGAEGKRLCGGHFADGEQGLIMAQKTIAADAAIVDLRLLDGLSLIRQLRARGKRMPVLILSAKASVDDRVEGLPGGQRRLPDQTFRVLRAAGARAGADPPGYPGGGADPAGGGGLTLDLLNRQVERGGERIVLQPREFALLEYLMRNAGA